MIEVAIAVGLVSAGLAIFTALCLHLEKKYEEKVKEVEEGNERYNTIVENIPVGVYIFQNDKHVFVNDALEKISGYTKDELLSLNPLDLLHPDYVDRSMQFMESALKGDTKVYSCIIKFTRKDGECRWVELRMVPTIYNGDKAILATVVDITKQMDLESQLKESEEMFRTLVEKSLAGIYLIQDGAIKYANPKLAEMYEYHVDELIGNNPLDYVHPEDRAKVEENIRARIKGEIPRTPYRVRAVRRNGKTRINEVFGSFVNYKGKPAIIGMLFDVTDSVRINSLLEIINNINGVVIQEKNIEMLIKKTCRILYSFNDYKKVSIGVWKDGRFDYVYSLPKEGDACFDVKMSSETTIENKNNFNRALIPMLAKGNVKGVLVVDSYEQFLIDEVRLLQTLANNLALAISSIELDEVKKRAYEQIKKNIEQYAILVDHIRNPLATIHAFAELYVNDKEISNKFVVQINRILNVIEKLDSGWVESERIKKFLERY
ncbi:hypothetical protein DRP05_14920 [Archaeoglobales archaeon]|nr:MAG: hypothetical protein DRP05_14920 [Archaeoglobales archaeon]